MVRRWIVFGIGLAVALMLLPKGAVTARAQQPTPTPTLGFIILLPTPTRTLGVIIAPPSPTPPSSAPATRTPTRTPSPTLPSFAIPSATPTTGSLVGQLPPSPTPHGDPYFPDFPFTLPSATATVQLSIGPEVPDLSLTDLEVTQGMQSLDNDMPLIGGRWTFVRAYVRSHGGNWHDVHGVLQGWRDGQYLGMIDPENGPINAYTHGGDRLNTDHTLNFFLPSYWRYGDLELRAFIYSGSPDAPFEEEQFWVNNFRELQAEFHTGSGVRLGLWPIHLHLGYNGANQEVTFTTDEPTLSTVLAGLKRLLPVKTVYVYPAPVTQVYCIATTGGEVGVGLVGGPDEHGPCEFDLQAVGGAQYVNQVMAWINMLTDDPAPGVINYGMVHPIYAGNMTFYNDTLIPLSYTGLALYGESYGLMSTSTWVNTPWQMTGGETLAHEIGHRLGLGHVNCAGNEELGGGLDDDFPWTLADCKLANISPTGFFGFDVAYSEFPGMTGPTVIDNDPGAAEPNLGFPLMGYQGPKWMDAYHYCTILDSLGVPCDKTLVPFLAGRSSGGRMSLAGSGDATVSGEAAGQLPPAQAADAPRLVVAVSVNRASEEATVDRAMVLADIGTEGDFAGGPSLFRRPTEFSVAVVDAKGEVVGLEPIYDTSTAHGRPAVLGGLVILPYPPEAAAIQVRKGDQVLAERTVSANPPQVRLLSPNGGEALTAPPEIRWEAEDADGDALDFTVQFSADGGQTWQVISFGHPDQVLQMESLDVLAGTDQGKFRVIASDGVLTGQDASDGVFSVPDTAPLPAITSPGHQAVYPRGATVPFSGSATDREDGILPDESLRWESDRDGPLGTGADLELRSLTPGPHVITLVASDSKGREGRATIGITVDAATVVDHLSQAELDAAAAVLAQHGVQGPGIPEEQPSSSPPPPAWLALVVIGLGAAALVASLLFFLPLLRQVMRR